MSSTVDADRDQLHELGYAQELHRGMGTFSNFAISFSIISILAGAITTFFLGMNLGGPRTIMVGWVVVGIFVMFVGASMGEILSTYPTAGGLYFWSAKLARKNAPVWSFFTGWFNLIGQIGVIASVDFALAKMTAFFLATFGSLGYHMTPRGTYLLFVIFLLLHGALNTFGVNLVKLLGDISVWWHVGGVGIIVGVLLIAPSQHESLSFLWKTNNNSGWTGGSSGLYVGLIGLLLAQYTITGFDASAHVSEETIGARTGAPKAIMRSIYVSAIAAILLNGAMLLAFPKGALTPDKDGALLFNTVAGNGINAGSVVFGFAGLNWGRLLIFIAIVGQFFCGMASVTANSRMIYAFSRDGALPGSKLWSKINKKTRTPTNSIWLGVVLSAVVGLISLVQKGGYEVAFFALTGIAVIGLYISYIIPVFLKLRNPEFKQGEWNLGKWSKPIGWVSVVWVVIITVLFFSPAFWPFWPIGDDIKGADGAVVGYTVNNFNFTGPLIIGSGILLGIYWMVSARKWFKGPKVQGTPEELRAIERELEGVMNA